MAEHAYVRLAGEYARRIRSGALPAHTRLHSYKDLAAEHNVSTMTIRQLISLLVAQGLVYTVERKGAFVAELSTLVRIAPERQLESAEQTYENESAGAEVSITRHVEEVLAPTELAEAFGLSEGDPIRWTVTRASEGEAHVSISDTYQPVHLEGIEAATSLEETLNSAIPSSEHSEWLGTGPEEMVPTVRQRFMDSADRVLMISEISYPPSRYEAFTFRMKLRD